MKRKRSSRSEMEACELQERQAPGPACSPKDMQDLGLESGDMEELAAAGDTVLDEGPPAAQQGPSASDDVVIVGEVSSPVLQPPQLGSSPAKHAASTPAGRAALLKRLQAEMAGLQETACSVPPPFPMEDVHWAQAPPDKATVGHLVGASIAPALNACHEPLTNRSCGRLCGMQLM